MTPIGTEMRGERERGRGEGVNIPIGRERLKERAEVHVKSQESSVGLVGGRVSVWYLVDAGRILCVCVCFLP